MRGSLPELFRELPHHHADKYQVLYTGTLAGSGIIPDDKYSGGKLF